MRLLTFTANGRTRAGLEVSGRIIDLAQAVAAASGRQVTGFGDVVGVLEAGDSGLRSARQAQDWISAELAAGRTPTHGGEQIVFDSGAVRIGPPIPRPGKIICLGRNYAEHAAEGGWQPPTVPILFAKFANTIIGPGDAIVLPKASQQMDYEAEFAVVIGERAKHASLEHAMGYVAGYMNLNDVSARDLQNESSQWLRGKGGDTFAPCGPYLVTKDEIQDPHALRIRGILNGEVMQDSNTRHLIFNVPFLIHHITKTMTLDPGDVISTGTPSGVGEHRKPPRFLRSGDVFRVEVEGLGSLENPVVEE